MKYYFRVEETRTAIVAVEADSVDEAFERVDDAYSEDKICLNNESYIDDGAEFHDETDWWGPMVEKGYPVNLIKLD